MRSLVVYVTHKGNTQRVAEAIAEVLREKGQVQLLPAEEAPASFDEVDLLLVGGPTEGHGMTPEQRAYLDRIEAGSLRDRPVAAFDTRLKWPRRLSSSASARARSARSIAAATMTSRLMGCVRSASASTACQATSIGAP